MAGRSCWCENWFGDGGVLTDFDGSREWTCNCGKDHIVHERRENVGQSPTARLLK